MSIGGEFAGNRRFEVRRRLGAGGFGVVYEAFDRERGEPVALKTLHRVDPATLYRFKQEFRALADVSHRNLVALHELHSEGGTWFFTMEMVAGVPFLEHVQGGGELASADTFVSDGASGALASAATQAAPRPAGGGGRGSSDVEIAGAETLRPDGPPPPAARLDFERLRVAVRQLAEGVAALHARGLLHRDLKPSNVLVGHDGRVVVLDFGLVAEIDPRASDGGTEGGLVGTAQYMSPEQAAALPLTGASDWYSVGAMLYEALVGRPPFTGKFLEVISEKQRRDPVAPGALRSGLPPDLEALCLDLLRRKPYERPPGAEVLRRLSGGARGEAPPAAAVRVSGIRAAPGDVRERLVGRERKLEALADALAATRASGRAIVACVHGPSGMGKSALARRFLDDLHQEGRAVALYGRCYERESVPYKAVDSLVDALTRLLRRLPAGEAEALLPRDVQDLARLFPVLLGVEAVERAPRRAQPTTDPQEARRRAFKALREMLARIADRRALILCVDDLQWGDRDGAALLHEVVRPESARGGAPPLLLVACYRSEDRERVPLLALLSGGAETVETRAIEVGPLAADEACALARARLIEEGGGAAAPDAALETVAEAIARESAGNPFFVEELVRYTLEEAAPAGRSSSEVTLGEVIRARVARLEPDARRLLEVVAVAGRPIAQGVAVAAAGVADGRAAVAALRGARLAKTSGTEGAVETYHDRIRETTAVSLPTDALRAHHLRLAHALEAAGAADPEVLHVHYHGAGELAKAGEYAALAADRAALALAFDRAARLYRLAIELAPGDAARTHALRVKLGDALVSAGRGAEAAEVYWTSAADSSDATERVELERRAAEQLLRTGRFEAGIESIRRVLGSLGMTFPETPGRALLSLLGRRIFVRLRGLGFRERREADVPPAELTRIDACWSIACALSTVDAIRGADFNARYLLLALRAGEPFRLSRALATEAAYAATAGRPGRARAERLRERATELARRHGHEQAIAYCLAIDGALGVLLGEWERTRRACEAADAIYRERCMGWSFEVATNRLFWLWALAYQGRLAELGRRAPAFLAEAEERGDHYAAACFRAGLPNLVWLARDDVERARAEAGASMRSFPRDRFLQQHYRETLALGNIDLYAGLPRAAFERMRERWPALKRSFLLDVQVIRAEMHELRARAALALAARADTPAGEREALLASAEGDARRLARERMPWVEPLGRLVLAQAGRLRAGEGGGGGAGAGAGGGADADAHLAAAIAGFEAAGMTLHAAVARGRSADPWLASEGVLKPERLAGMLAPGLSNPEVRRP